MARTRFVVVAALGWLTSVRTSGAPAAPLPASSSAQPASSASSAPSSTSNPPVAALGPSPAATAPTVSQVGGVIVAIDGAGAVVWRHEIVPDFTPERTDLRGPIVVGTRVFYAVHKQLWETDLATGLVQRRHELAGACASITARDGGVIVVAGEPGFAASWRLEQSVDSGAKPLFSGTTTAALLLQNQAWKVVPPAQRPPEARSRRERDAAWKEPARRAALEAAVPELQARGDRDPTNPWYRVVQARFLDYLGRTDEAKRVRDSLRTLDAPYDPELLGASTEIDADDSKLADALFMRGMKAFLEHGYEPELNMGPAFVEARLGALKFEGLDPTRAEDLVRLDRLVERQHTFAPGGALRSGLSSGLARAHRQAGNAARAAVWDERARAEASAQHTVYPSTDARELGKRFTMLTGLLAAFLITFVVRSLRTAGTKFPGAVHPWVRFNPLSRWTTEELVGFLALVPLTYGLALRVATGFAIVVLSADAPPTLGAGFLGHPGGDAFLRSGGSSRGGALVNAMQSFRAGKLDEAEAGFRTLWAQAASDSRPFPEAENNLAVVMRARGNVEDATARFTAVADAVPEAAAALGRPAVSDRVARARLFGLESPLLALPTQARWDEFWRARVDATDDPRLQNPHRALLGMPQYFDRVAQDGQTILLQVLLSIFFTGLAPILSVLALVALFTRSGLAEPTPRRLSRVGWALGVLVPGGARQWSFVGPLFTAAFLTAAYGALQMRLADNGPSVLDNAWASSTRLFYGIDGGALNPALASLTAVSSVWWVFVVVQLAFVAVAERVRPDPAGPFRARGG